MDKLELEEYLTLNDEIETIEMRIKKTEERIEKLNLEGAVIDKVMGGEGGWQSFKIEGFPQREYDKCKEQLRKLHKRLSEQRLKLIIKENDIEEFITTIPNSRDRDVFRLIFLEGYSQQAVAEKYFIEQPGVSRIISRNLKKV